MIFWSNRVIYWSNRVIYWSNRVIYRVHYSQTVTGVTTINAGLTTIYLYFHCVILIHIV